MSVIPLSRLLTEGRPDAHPVAWRKGEIMDFARFRNDVAVAARRLDGCRAAALVCADSYAFAVGLFGLLHAGARVVLPANGLCGRQTVSVADGVCDRVVGDDILASGPSRTLTPIDPDASGFDFFTSGSTGAPKRIQKSLRLLENELLVLDQVLGTAPGTGPVLATVSHQHVYGLTFKILLSLAAGRFFDGAMHDLWETVLPVLSAPAVLVTSPAHLSRMGGLSALPASARPSLILSAGAPLSLAAARDCDRLLGGLPLEIFGSTETGAIATRRQQDADALWRPLPGIAARADAAACLQLRTPFVGPAWITTDDRVDWARGGFRFLGRADRVVKIEGNRVSLPEVEQALANLPWVDAAAAVLLPGAQGRLAAVVVPNAQGRQRLQSLGAFRFGRQLRQDLALTLDPAGLPKQWRFVPALPRGAMDKLREEDLRALFETAP